MDIKLEIYRQAVRSWPEMGDAERKIYNLLNRLPRGAKMTQVQIARSEPYLGQHPQFERHPTSGTSLRRVRQIIHDLKVKHRIVIVSDVKGYWIPETLKEAETYLDSMERQARSSAKSYMVTAAVMTEAIAGLKPRNMLFDLTGEENEQLQAVQ